ncbi:bestrophin-like domain [Streptomyces phaeofaciens]|uniref:bestrophin-like domain n=1 Tax=Streptomyces phaeofaciens TaxID=68254 RepID=UPI00368B2FB4
MLDPTYGRGGDVVPGVAGVKGLRPVTMERSWKVVGQELQVAGRCAAAMWRSRERAGGDVVNWLISLPAVALVVGGLLLAFLVAAAARIGVRALVPVGEQDRVPQIATPLMPTLGAAFAIFAALSLASEAGYLRAAEALVSDEAAAASRLAWAATSPRVHSEPIHAALQEYLRTTRAREWKATEAASGDDPATARAIARLERIVRAEAARPEVGTPTGTELVVSLDGVTSGRRARIAAAARDVPALYVVTLVVSGLALIVNSGALVFRSSPRTSLLVTGVASVVGLSLALLFALSAPWSGALIVTGHPLDAIIGDLSSGFFSGRP